MFSHRGGGNMGGGLSPVLGGLRLVCIVLYKDGAWEFGVSE